MKTVVVLIGNSDNKLTQQEWASFVIEMREHLGRHQAYFFGGPENWQAWQNACWVIGVVEEHLEELRIGVCQIRKKWRQDSAAVIVGETEFV